MKSSIYLICLGLAACALPNTHFEAGGDAAGNVVDPNMQRIVVSATSLAVDEGSDTMFTVALALPPTTDLARVQIGTASQKIGISLPELVFDTSTYAIPQSVTVVGLLDPDTLDESAMIVLDTAMADPVSIQTTVHDKDVVAFVTDLGATPAISIDEQTSATMHVHLSAQPTATVTVAVTPGTGPVTASPSILTFTQQNYGTDQAITLTAPDDANTVSEVETLALTAPGISEVDVTMHDIDNDTLNIAVAPSSLAVIEQGAAGTLAVSLTQQPSADTVVTLATTTGSAALDKTQLTFTTQNYNTVQNVHVTGVADSDTVDNVDTIKLDAAGLTERTVAITVHDDDVQKIVDDAPSTLQVTENATATFTVHLAFMPIANTIVAVSSLSPAVATAAPGILTFTPANYAMPQTVTVHGTKDNNVVTDFTTIHLFEASIGPTDVAVAVADADTQKIVTSVASIAVAEGGTGTFTAALAFDPSGSVDVTVISSNAASLPVAPNTLTFTSLDYATPKTVTVSPPIDTNTISESATITLTGAGAAPATVAAMVSDTTVTQQFGYPTQLANVATLPVTQIIALKISVDPATTLDTFSVFAVATAFAPVVIGDYRMALYDDNNGQPNALVASFARQPISYGANTYDLSPDVALAKGVYWIAIRVAQSTPVGSGAVGSSTICIGPAPSSLDTAWSPTFGAASCTPGTAMNFWINTYHQ